jgi:hypothetical protein
LVRGDTIRGVPGQQKTAYVFDEPGSWVEVPNDSSLDPAGWDFAVSSWVKLTGAPNGHHTFDVVRRGLSYTKTGMYKLEVVSDGRARCTAKDTERHKARITSPQTDLADGAWHQIGCARVGSTWSVVVDGLATSKESALGVIENDNSLSIGSKYGTEDPVPGAVDDVLLIVDLLGSVPAHDASLAEKLDRLERLPPVGHWRLDESPVALDSKVCC